MGTAIVDQIREQSNRLNAFIPKRDPGGNTFGMLYSERATFLEASISSPVVRLEGPANGPANGSSGRNGFGSFGLSGT